MHCARASIKETHTIVCDSRRVLLHVLQARKYCYAMPTVRLDARWTDEIRFAARLGGNTKQFILNRLAVREHFLQHRRQRRRRRHLPSHVEQRGAYDDARVATVVSGYMDMLTVYILPTTREIDFLRAFKRQWADAPIDYGADSETTPPPTFDDLLRTVGDDYACIGFRSVARSVSVRVVIEWTAFGIGISSYAGGADEWRALCCVVCAALADLVLDTLEYARRADHCWRRDVADGARRS